MENEFNQTKGISKHLKRSVYGTQFIILVIALICIWFFIGYSNFTMNHISLNSHDIVFYGIGGGLLLIIFNILLNVLIPERLLDDGGFNKQFFSSLSLIEISFLCILISLSEELMFRGFLQTKFGIIIASIIFALVHFRYVKKIVLLTVVLLESFFLGYLYLITANLIVVIVTHFILDYVLGLYMKFSMEREENE